MRWYGSPGAGQERLDELRAKRQECEESGQLFGAFDELRAVERGYEQAVQLFNERITDLSSCYELVSRCIRAAQENSESPGEHLVAVGSIVDVRVATELVDSELLQLTVVCNAVEQHPDFDAGKAVFRRSQLLDAALHRDGHPPVFMALSEEQQLLCGNEFMRLLAEANQANGSGVRGIVNLIDGGTSLSESLGLDLEPLLGKVSGRRTTLRIAR